VVRRDLCLSHVHFLCRSQPAAVARPGLSLRTKATTVEFS
jgi:hypothetical protein